MSEKIKMKVNERKLVATMKDAFTNDYSVITEMAQNARRAGATEITFRVGGLEEGEKKSSHISKDEIPFHMEVIDNGSGISDMQDLINVANSGWDEDTVEKENPFGMGFLISIYSSEAIDVQSKGRRFKATKEQLLNLEEIEVTKCRRVNGTSITLKNIGLSGVNSIKDLKDLMWNLLVGFPIKVNLEVKGHGVIECVTPKYSIATLEGPRSNFTKHEFPEGDFYLKNDYTLGTYHYHSSPKTLPLFQGLLVEKLRSSSSSLRLENSYEDVQAIIHLKDSIGAIRLPDRDSFVNNAEVSAKIDLMSKKVVKDYIMSKKDDYSFLSKYCTSLAAYDCIHLLNAHERIPSYYLEAFAETNVNNYNNQSEGSSESDWLLVGGPSNFTKATSDDFIVIEVPDHVGSMFDLWDEDANAFALVYALEESGVDYVLINSSKLDKDHWAIENIIPIQDLIDSVHVEVEDQRDPVSKQQGFYLEFSIKFCSSFNISFKANGETYYSGAVTNGYVLCETNKESVVMYSNGCNSESVVVDAGCFMDEYNYDDSAERYATDEFTKWLKRERCNGDPVKLIERYLEEADLALFDGQEFKLKINKKTIEVEKLQKGA